MHFPNKYILREFMKTEFLKVLLLLYMLNKIGVIALWHIHQLGENTIHPT